MENLLESFDSEAYPYEPDEGNNQRQAIYYFTDSEGHGYKIRFEKDSSLGSHVFVGKFGQKTPGKNTYAKIFVAFKEPMRIIRTILDITKKFKQEYSALAHGVVLKVPEKVFGAKKSLIDRLIARELRAEFQLVDLHLEDEDYTKLGLTGHFMAARPRKADAVFSAEVFRKHVEADVNDTKTNAATAANLPPDTPIGNDKGAFLNSLRGMKTFWNPSNDSHVNVSQPIPDQYRTARNSPTHQNARVPAMSAQMKNQTKWYTEFLSDALSGHMHKFGEDALMSYREGVLNNLGGGTAWGLLLDASGSESGSDVFAVVNGIVRTMKGDQYFYNIDAKGRHVVVVYEQSLKKEFQHIIGAVSNIRRDTTKYVALSELSTKAGVNHTHYHVVRGLNAASMTGYVGIRLKTPHGLSEMALFSKMIKDLTVEKLGEKAVSTLSMDKKHVIVAAFIPQTKGLFREEDVIFANSLFDILERKLADHIQANEKLLREATAADGSLLSMKTYAGDHQLLVTFKNQTSDALKQLVLEHSKDYVGLYSPDRSSVLFQSIELEVPESVFATLFERVLKLLGGEATFKKPSVAAANVEAQKMNLITATPDIAGDVVHVRVNIDSNVLTPGIFLEAISDQKTTDVVFKKNIGTRTIYLYVPEGIDALPSAMRLLRFVDEGLTPLIKDTPIKLSNLVTFLSRKPEMNTVMENDFSDMGASGGKRVLIRYLSLKANDGYKLTARAKQFVLSNFAKMDKPNIQDSRFAVDNEKEVKFEMRFKYNLVGKKTLDAFNEIENSLEDFLPALIEPIAALSPEQESERKMGVFLSSLIDLNYTKEFRDADVEIQIATVGEKKKELWLQSTFRRNTATGFIKESTLELRKALSILKARMDQGAKDGAFIVGGFSDVNDGLSKASEAAKEKERSLDQNGDPIYSEYEQSLYYSLATIDFAAVAPLSGDKANVTVQPDSSGSYDFGSFIVIPNIYDGHMNIEIGLKDRRLTQKLFSAAIVEVADSELKWKPMSSKFLFRAVNGAAALSSIISKLQQIKSVLDSYLDQDLFDLDKISTISRTLNGGAITVAPDNSLSKNVDSKTRIYMFSVTAADDFAILNAVKEKVALTLSALNPNFLKVEKVLDDSNKLRYEVLPKYRHIPKSLRDLANQLAQELSAEPTIAEVTPTPSAKPTRGAATASEADKTAFVNSINAKLSEFSTGTYEMKKLSGSLVAVLEDRTITFSLRYDVSNGRVPDFESRTMELRKFMSRGSTPVEQLVRTANAKLVEMAAALGLKVKGKLSTSKFIGVSLDAAKDLMRDPGYDALQKYSEEYRFLTVSPYMTFEVPAKYSYQMGALNESTETLDEAMPKRQELWDSALAPYADVKTRMAEMTASYDPSDDSVGVSFLLKARINPLIGTKIRETLGKLSKTAGNAYEYKNATENRVKVLEILKTLTILISTTEGSDKKGAMATAKRAKSAKALVESLMSLTENWAIEGNTASAVVDGELVQLVAFNESAFSNTKVSMKAFVGDRLLTECVMHNTLLPMTRMTGFQKASYAAQAKEAQALLDQLK